MDARLSLDRYRLLGRSGLRISPIVLGSMTFGSEWGWGSDREETSRIFSAYVDRGGNFIDTANQYTDGTSEKLIGEFSEGKRDSLVIATKYTLPSRDGGPNSGGNHRKSMMRSVEASLRRLATDYIDLLYLHAWDSTTPVDEILKALDDLVTAGKVLYVGISNTMAWQVARMQAIAEIRGWSRFVALQVEYSLIERTVERELLPMARELGLGVIPWSPLGGGVLTGKYSKSDREMKSEGTLGDGCRKSEIVTSGVLSDRNLSIADVVREIGRETGRSPAQIALAWILRNPAVGAPIIGARTLKQLEENLDALNVELTGRQLDRLNTISSIELGFPHDYLLSLMKSSYMREAMDLY